MVSITLPCFFIQLVSQKISSQSHPYFHSFHPPLQRQNFKIRSILGKNYLAPIDTISFNYFLRVNPAAADKNTQRCVNNWQMCQLVKIMAELLKFTKNEQNRYIQVPNINLAYSISYFRALQSFYSTKFLPNIMSFEDSNFYRSQLLKNYLSFGN